METQVIPYRLAYLAKTKEFKEPCLCCYDGCEMLSTYITNIFEPKNYNVGGGKNTSAPTYQQIIDWLYKISEGDIYFTYDPSETTEYRNQLLEKCLNRI